RWAGRSCVWQKRKTAKRDRDENGPRRLSGPFNRGFDCWNRSFHILVPDLVSCLGVTEHELRRGFVQFKLIAHFLETCIESVNLLLLCRYECSLFLHFALLFEKRFVLLQELVEQHCIHLIVVHTLRLPFRIACYQSSVYLAYFLGNQTKGGRLLGIDLLFVAVGDRFKPIERFAGVGYRF